METEQTIPAAYLPFNTFLTGLDYLASIGIPSKLEGRAFTSMSSHNQAQMMTALRFFELINAENKPQPLLSDLAHKKDSRQQIMHDLLKKYYPDIIAADLSTMIPSQLEAALAQKKYNVQGDTRKKAKTFLLKAAAFAGYKPHPLLTKITRNRRKGAGAGKAASAGGSKAAQAETNGDADTDASPPPPRQDEPQGTQKTIQLRRGGSLTLSLAVNLLQLKGEDRAFVFELIDRLEEYEEKASALPLQEPTEPGKKPEGSHAHLFANAETNQ